MELLGKPVSQGIAIGQVLRYEVFCPQLTQIPLAHTEIAQALTHYEQVHALAQAELDILERRLMAESPDKAKIIAAHRDILLDPAMEEGICDMVSNQYMSPDAAIDAEKFCKEKSTLFIVLPEEDLTKHFMVSLMIQQLYREISAVADENGGKLKNRVLFYVTSWVRC